MRRPLMLGSSAMLLVALGAGFALRPARLLGQTQNEPFSYVGLADQKKNPPRGLPEGPATSEQVLRGRYLVTSAGCTACHSHGKDDPNDPQWLSGYNPALGDTPFQIGPFKTYAANLTPDTATGIGGHSDRQIFNALRFGLDPANGPDLPITSSTPGQGNFPTDPHYLAPPMPWPEVRNFSDADIWAIVAYLKHGIKPVANAVPDSEGPPDHWASAYTPDKTGPFPLPAYPAANETFTP